MTKSDPRAGHISRDLVVGSTERNAFNAAVPPRTFRGECKYHALFLYVLLASAAIFEEQVVERHNVVRVVAVVGVVRDPAGVVKVFVSP